MEIRPETPGDVDAIGEIHHAAFASHPFSKQTEHLIVEELRKAGALSLSLVAELDGRVVGHVALSPTQVGQGSGWFLLGPIGVLPEYQGRGVGRALIESAIDGLRTSGAPGCVLVGDPEFYSRFGFTHVPGVTSGDVPEEYVLSLTLSGEEPSGEVRYHEAFLVGTDSA